MKPFLLLFGILAVSFATGQNKTDVKALPKVEYKPKVYINETNRGIYLSRTDLFQYGLKIVLEDTSFKVNEFTIMYDCHSRAYFDFSSKRYIGNTVPSNDDFLRNQVWVGDFISITQVIIEKNGYRFVMKELGCIIRE